MKKVVLYTDGACSGNPGPGGYGAVLIYGGVEKEIFGGEKSTTNNKMEMMAVIKGKVIFNKVKGHADDEYNNRCDRIAVREREKFA